jgi:hypothetical protein
MQFYIYQACPEAWVELDARGRKKEGGALSDNTNLHPLTLSLPQYLEEHEGGVEGDILMNDLDYSRTKRLDLL